MLGTRRLTVVSSVALQVFWMAATAEAVGAEELYRKHARFVARFLTHLRVASADIEDHVQEVFLIAHKRGGFVPGEASPITWLARIAINVSMTRKRSVRRRREEMDPAVGELPGFAPGPDRAAETAQSLERVQRALDTLDLEQRALFVLFELEGESCAEIAAGLDVPIGTVYSRLHTARAAFVKVYEGLP